MVDLEAPVEEANFDSLMGNEHELPPIPEMLGETTSVKAPYGNRLSNLNFSANVSALAAEPESMVEVYRQIDDELSTTGSSQTATNLIAQVAEEEIAQYKAQVTSMILDPNVPDSDKVVYANAVYNKFPNAFSVHDHIVTRAAIAPSGREDLNQESARVSLASVAKEYNDYRKLSQDILNREVSKLDSESMNAFADIFQYLLPGAQGEFTSKVLAGMREGDSSTFDKLATFFKMGHDTQKMRDMIASVPFKDRAIVLEKFQQLAHSPKSIFTWDENDYARYTMLRSVLEEGGYDNVDKWVDTVTGWLDLVGLGGSARRIYQTHKLSKELQAELEYVNEVSRVYKDGAKPASYSAAVQDANPDKAMAVAKAVDQDLSDETAIALTGVTRDSYLTDALTPEVATPSGAVASKPSVTFMDEDISKQFLYGVHPNDFYTFAEEEVARLQNIAGVSARPEMFSVQNTDFGLGVKGVYGPPSGAWTNPDMARKATELAMRRFNIDPKDITILERKGTIYVPTGRKKDGQDVLGVDREYLAQVNFTRVYDTPSSTVDFDVVKNVLDVNDIGIASSAKHGSLSANLLSFRSMLPPRLTRGAEAAEDRSAFLHKKMLTLADPFTKAIVKMPKERQTKVMDFIRMMNDKREWPSDSEMMVRYGLRRNEVEALESWRAAWDMVYHVEQRDLNKALKQDGWYSYVNKDTNTDLIAKPYARQGVPANVTVLDEVANVPRTLSKSEVDNIYASGGSVMKLKTPLNVGNDDIFFIVNRNNSSSYAREINDSYNSLQYLPGYYTRRYTENFFVVRKYKDRNGNHIPEYDRVVANVPSLKEANLTRDDLIQRKGYEYYIREDLKKGELPSDVAFGMAHSAGRLAQKHRGERLAGFADGVIAPTETNVMGPIDSLMVQVASLSKRVAFRDMLDNYRATYMQKYGEFLPSDSMGGKQFPASVDQIAYRPGSGKDIDKKKLGDAKTVFSHINYLENGYMNMIDEVVRKSLKGIADLLDSPALYKASQVNATSVARSAVFNSLIALNPFRQMVIQSHQVLQLIPHYGPKVFAQSFKEAPAILMMQMAKGDFSDPILRKIMKEAFGSVNEARLAYNQLVDSGLIANIDRNNMVRESMIQLADGSNIVHKSKVGRALTKPLDISRKIGFDAGENTLMTFAYVAARRNLLNQRAAKGSKSTKLSAVEEAQIASEARGVTLSMNRAGDQPYNQNTLSLFMQFQQVPHKVLLQMTTDRNFSKATKYKLWAFNTFMYGIPLGFGAAIIENLGLDKDQAELATELNKGFESFALNALLAGSKKDFEFGDAGIDFSGLAPWDLHGTYEMYRALWSEGLGGFVSKAPITTLAKRITDIHQTAARAFNFDTANHNDWFKEHQTDFWDVADSIARLSSGWSNYRKAELAWETKQKAMKNGLLSDDDVTRMQAFFTALGFRTEEEMERMYVSQSVRRFKKDFEDQVNKEFDVFVSGITTEGLSFEDKEALLAAFELNWSTYRGAAADEARKIISKRIDFMLEAGDDTLFKSVMDYSVYGDAGKISAVIANLPPSENPKVNEDRKAVLDSIEEIRRGYEE